METASLIATAQATVNAPVDKVWEALVNPALIKKYMFGTNVVSDWKPGSAITWSGEWQGKKYEDKGVIKQIIPNKKLQYTHFSPLSGVPDVPENYHTVTVELTPQGNSTVVTLQQDNSKNEEERTHSEKNWNMMLEGLKKLLEAE